ncbi:hypothetical protein H0H87_007311 [Tephrocybe sp. NHM501043]|nr:hypothetical protein H0H87_007311 [Tephrocybe sp. NHM501043]
MTNTSDSLLSDTHDTTTNEIHNPPKPKRTPLPKFQLFIVLLIQFAEPITATVIYPFINQFVRDTGVINGDERKTGYYAGAIESTFFIAEALTVVYWGRASDYFGRRPVLLLGPLGLSLGVSKSVVGEITDSTNLADAFALMPLMWSIGATIGLLTGHNEQGYSATTNASNIESIQPENSDVEDLQPPSLPALLVPRVMLTLAVHACLAFSDMSTQVLLPLVYSTSISLGGLGFNPYRIGTIMGTWGIINAIFQLTCLGWVLRKFGARNVQIFAHFSYCVVLVLYPLLSCVAHRAGGADSLVWAIIVIQLTFALSNSAAYASILMLLLDSSPSRASLGTVNGLAQAISCVTRGLAPTVASSLFSVSLEKQLAGGNMVFIILFVTSAIGLRLTFLLSK